MNYLFKEKTFQIIGAAREVHRELGPGFLEVVYQDALEIEFQLREIPYHREYQLPIIVETKAVKSLNSEFYAQALHYLKATKLKLALLINFGELSLKVKRIIH